MSSPPKKRVVVVGAGVIGLTTAVKIQEEGHYDVTIISEIFPSDPKDIRYTSLWAGAHHVSHAEGEPKQQAIDQETFNVLWNLSAPGGEAEGCFLRIRETDFFYDGRDVHLDWMPDHQVLPSESLVAGAGRGITFSTVTIDTPAYCNYLLSRFLGKGGKIVRGSVQHLNQIAEGGPHAFTSSRAGRDAVDAIVVCTGLGARTLGGVEDKDVYPVRGQIVIIRAPWIRFGMTASHASSGLWTYVIPRRSGDVILGGTKVDNDWYPVARPTTTTEILERCLALCPELAPPEIRSQRAPTVEDLRPLIVEEGCGFRPVRKGGVRIEADNLNLNGKDLPVIYNYGHGGGGYQSSWGTASIALDLLKNALV
ncbi:D-amino-acid oxidase [Trametopsis cervina]|nr:D-amino-acid oxidase [Trametopsis cervina]